MRRIIFLLFAVVMICGPLAQSQAANNLTCAATFSNDLILSVPIITFNGQDYWATFQYFPNTIDFTLTSVGLIGDTSPFSACPPATLSPDLELQMPVVILNGASYWANLQYKEGVNFTLSGAGTNLSSLGELQTRVNANQTSFYVYKDQDSGFNHGFPSGFFANSSDNLKTIHLDTGCVDDAGNTTTGCYLPTDTDKLDTSRGTVMRISLDAQSTDSFAGVNFEEPQNWGRSQSGSGYDLRGAHDLVFDVRSPDMATVQFGVGECVTLFQHISRNWETVKIPLSSLVPPPGLPVSCPPALNNVHILFSVVTNSQYAPKGGTVLLDNIRFTPVPARATQTQEGENMSLPLSNQTFGVVPQTAGSIPPDQANRNIAAIYEAALTIQNLLAQGDNVNAKKIADALDYALYHDNEGDYISTAPGATSGCFSGRPATQCGLHNAYESGDIALLNDQNESSGGSKAGDIRLAGFTCGAMSPTGYCLVLDGATGGNNAWAILALLAEYKHSGDSRYLNDAITIGNWIVENLTDRTGTGFGGYYVGYPDEGTPAPKALNMGKSTENNADIFAAFTALSKFDRGDADAWTKAANVAGDFVMQMFDQVNGRFNAGTVTANPPTSGVCQRF